MKLNSILICLFIVPGLEQLATVPKVTKKTTWDNVNYLITNISASYNDAIEVCNSLEADLIRVVTEKIHNQIRPEVGGEHYWTHVPDLNQFAYNTDAVVWNTSLIRSLDSSKCVLVIGSNLHDLKFHNADCNKRHRVVCEKLRDVEGSFVWRAAPYGVKYAVSKREYTWHEAEKYCRQDNATLAKIMSKQEHDWIRGLLVTELVGEGWLGGHSFINSFEYQTYAWSDSTPIVYSRLESLHCTWRCCAILFEKEYGRWTDSNHGCNRLSRAICQKNTGSYAQQFDFSLLNSGDRFSKYFIRNSKHYLFRFDLKMTFGAAQEYCHLLNASLVKVESQSEAEWVLEVLGGDRKEYFMAAHRGAGGEWRSWDDGSAIEWTNWESEVASRLKYHCNAIVAGWTTSFWSTGRCDFARLVICQSDTPFGFISDQIYDKRYSANVPTTGNAITVTLVVISVVLLAAFLGAFVVAMKLAVDRRRQTKVGLQTRSRKRSESKWYTYVEYFSRNRNTLRSRDKAEEYYVMPRRHSQDYEVVNDEVYDDVEQQTSAA